MFNGTFEEKKFKWIGFKIKCKQKNEWTNERLITPEH